MEKIMKLLENGGANLKLEVSGEDLMAFSNDLINRAKSELAVIERNASKVKFLSKQEVKSIFGVCDTTLWHWNKRGYLRVVKLGNKVCYRKLEVDKILGDDGVL